MTAAATRSVTELASMLRPSVLRLARIIRNQRVDTTVSLNQLSVLGTLRKHGSMSAGELASCERVQPPSLTKILADLEKRELVRREASPTDRRQAIIMLTPAGKELLDRERRSRTAWLVSHLAQLDADERAKLLEVVPILDKLAELP